MLGFAMHPSEFLLRRTVFFVASTLLDSSSFVLPAGFDVSLFATLNSSQIDLEGLNFRPLSDSRLFVRRLLCCCRIRCILRVCGCFLVLLSVRVTLYLRDSMMCVATYFSLDSFPAAG